MAVLEKPDKTIKGTEQPRNINSSANGAFKHTERVYIYIYNVCMFVCMYVRTYVCMYVCVYVCMYASVCMYVCECMYVCMYIYICVCVSEWADEQVNKRE